MAGDWREYGRRRRHVENERARLAEARKSPQQLEQYDLSLLESAERRLKDLELGQPEAEAKWLEEQKRIVNDWAPAFDSGHDVGMQALDRLYEAEWEMSDREMFDRDFRVLSVCVEKVIEGGFDEFLLSENEAGDRTGLTPYAARRSLKALSKEGRYLRRRKCPQGENNKKQWRTQQGKGLGVCTNVYFIPLHRGRNTAESE